MSSRVCCTLGKVAPGLVLALLAGGCSAPDRLDDRALDVYLITLDTTRADHLGCYGHEAISTPNFDRLAAEGVLYESAFTPVPITLPAHTAMLTGTYPAFHGVRENGGFYVPEELETLAEVLGARGYDTGAFVGAFPLDSQTGIDQGFALYDDNYPSRLEQGQHPRLRRFFDERPAADVARAAMAWIDGRGRRPFFLWTHFFDPHQPLTPPSPYRERYAKAPYDAEIASVDEAVGQILSRLEEIGRLDRALVILTADHGEGLGEHGEQTHALLLYSSTVRVPLIVRDPRDPPGRRVTAPVSTVDIFSTVLDRLGLELPAANQGVPLPRTDAEADHGRELYSETLFGRLIYGWSPLQRLTTGTEVYIRGPSQRLHDRAADPDELTDLSAGRPRESAGLARRARRRQLQIADGGHGFSRAQVSPETLARLAALGYVGAGSATGELSDAVDPSRPDPLALMEVFDLQNEGQALISEGHLELAIPVLERARALDPKNPMVLQNLAQAQIALGQLEQGHATLAALLAADPEHVSAHLLLSGYHRARGELEAAVSLLERAVELDPADLSTLLLLAYLLEDVGRVEDAEATFHALLEQERDHVLAANALATLKYRRGDVEGAVELLEKALELQPFYAPACLNLGVIEYDRGRHQRSRMLAQRALALRPGYPQAVKLIEMNQEALAR